MVKSIGVVGYFDPTCVDLKEFKMYEINNPRINTEIKKDGQTNRREKRKNKRK